MMISFRTESVNSQFNHFYKSYRTYSNNPTIQFSIFVQIVQTVSKSIIQMFQGGVTDIATSKLVARKLYMQYSSGSQMERQAMEKMLVDTYKIMNKQYVPTSQDVNLYTHILDTNGDGRVSLQDFQSLAIKYLARSQKKSYTKNVRERLAVAKRLFQKFDRDKSGFLSQDEIPQLIKETYNMMGMSYNPTKEDIDSWMAMTDLDGDGKVNLQDYERLIIASLQKCGIKIYERE